LKDALIFALKRAALFWVLCLSVIGAVQIGGPLMAPIEGALFLVTSKITFVSVVPDGGDLLVQFTYDKLRLCKAPSIGGNQAGKPVPMALAVPGPVQTRILGPQLSGIWRFKTKTLDGLDVYYLHECGPFWLTLTKVFP
jgi:hypothetical protein